jgi:hypothetical protein
MNDALHFDAGTRVTFADVKNILDGLIAAWKQKNRRDPDLGGHADDFGAAWATRESLLGAIAYGYPLIDRSKPGKDSNLVVALRQGVGGNPRMPMGGPYASQADLDRIAAWIDAGTPE